MSIIPLTTSGSLGEEVVETEEVAIGRRLAGEGGVAAVVIERRIVEPGRRFAVSSAFDRKIGV
jgi:hypothetical protein